MDKKSLRKQIKQIRNELTDDECLELGELISTRFLMQKEYKESDTLLIYMDFKKEVITKFIINQAFKDHKKVYVPKVHGDIMDFYEISSLNDCIPGCMGILEPKELKKTYQYTTSNSTLMVVPGLAFDKEGNRLGYGGGYYDKYLEHKNGIYKCAIAYDFQFLQEVETHEKDIKMDMLITEKRIIHYD